MSKDQIILIAKEQITLIIAILSFMLSLYNFFYSLLINRSNLKLIYKSHSCCNLTPEYPIIFNLVFENKSRLDISISRLFLKVNESTYEFDSETNWIGEKTNRTGNKITDKITLYSLEIPQTISGLGAIGGYFWVGTYKKIEFNKSDQVTIIAYTNRGKFKYPINFGD